MKAIAAALKEATAQTAKSQKLKDRDGLVDADRASRLFLFLVNQEVGRAASILHSAPFWAKKNDTMTFARNIERRFRIFRSWMVRLVGLSRSTLKWLETQEKTSSLPCSFGSLLPLIIRPE